MIPRSVPKTSPSSVGVATGACCSAGGCLLETAASCALSGGIYQGGSTICSGRGEEFDLDGDSLSECSGDCDETNPDTYGGAPEINDGLDNQCPGDLGHGLIDEISGATTFTTAGGEDFCWPAQGGASNYQVVRARSSDFTADRLTFTTSNTCQMDPDTPPLGGLFIYAARSLTPNTGSWGADAFGIERIIPCGP